GGLVERRTGLDGDRAGDAVRAQQRLEVARRVAASERRHLVRHPGVLGELRIPEVLVRVDDQASRSGRGAQTRLISTVQPPSFRGRLTSVPRTAAYAPVPPMTAAW